MRMAGKGEVEDENQSSTARGQGEWKSVSGSPRVLHSGSLTLLFWEQLGERRGSERMKGGDGEMW